MTTYDEREQNSAEILINFIFEFCDTSDTYSGPIKVGTTISFFSKSDIEIEIGEIGQFDISIDNNLVPSPNHTFNLFINPLKLKSAITTYRMSKKKDAVASAFNIIMDNSFVNISRILEDKIKRNFYINTNKFASGSVIFWANDLVIDNKSNLPWGNRDNFAEEFDMYNELHQRIYEIDQWIVSHMKGET